MLDEVNGIMISNVVKSNTDCPVYGLVSLVVFMLFFPLRKQPGSIWVEWDIIDITWQCNIQITPTAYWLVPLMVKMGSSSVICICIFDLPFASLYSLSKWHQSKPSQVLGSTCIQPFPLKTYFVACKQSHWYDCSWWCPGKWKILAFPSVVLALTTINNSNAMIPDIVTENHIFSKSLYQSAGLGFVSYFYLLWHRKIHPWSTGVIDDPPPICSGSLILSAGFLDCSIQEENSNRMRHVFMMSICKLLTIYWNTWMVSVGKASCYMIEIPWRSFCIFQQLILGPCKWG